MKTTKYVLTQAQMHELFVYDPLTGILCRKTALGGLKPTGTPNALPTGRIYLKAVINGVQYPVHRLIWLLVYGELPTGRVEHIDGNGLNNKLNNLMAVSKEARVGRARANEPIWSPAKRKWTVKKGKETFEYRNLILATRKAEEATV